MADGSITVTREASMEELRKSVAELLGEPADWPDHGNAPLAIAATMALLLEGCKRLEAENATLKRDLQYARDGLTRGRSRMREDNERLRAENAALKLEAHAWSKAAETYATSEARLVEALRKIEAGYCIDWRTVAREALGPNA